MDPYIQNNRSYDTDLLILRSLFALNPDTNLPISTNYIMTTDGAGGISWIDPIIFGGISLPNLVSTVGGLGSIRYVSTSYLNTALTSTAQGLATLNYVSTSYLNTALTSSLTGLATLNYVSTSYFNTVLTSTLNRALISTTLGLGTINYVSTSALISTTAYILDRSRYVSTGALQSTVAGILVNADFALQIGDFNTAMTSTSRGLGTLGFISTAQFRSSFTSTVGGLGSAGYISTAQLRSSVVGLGTAGYVSTSYLANYVTEAIDNAGTTGNYVSVTTLNVSLQNTTKGLGTVGYVSTSYLVNYVTNALANVGTTGDYISVPTLNLILTSTTLGLGTLNYLSTSALESTVAYLLDPASYVSTGALQSTTQGILASATVGLTIGTLNDALTSTISGLASAGYISTLSLESTIKNLGSGGDRSYISSLSLQSTTQKLTDMILGGTNISFDAANNVTIVGGTINIANMGGSIIYLSTFLQSSVTYQGTNGHTFPYAFGDTNMIFSSCVVPFNAMSSFTNEKSRVYLDIFPTFVFAQNGVSPYSAKTLILPISTFIQYGSLTANVQSSNLLPYVNTSYLVANTVTTGFSNYFQQQIKLQIPGSIIAGNWANDYILYHYMPNSISFGASPGLRNSTITIQYSSTNSVFISVQNLP